MAIVENGEDLEGFVEPKDCIGTSSSHKSPERAVYDVLDLDHIDTETLVRIASIDGGGPSSSYSSLQPASIGGLPGPSGHLKSPDSFRGRR